jgi:branched-chain amino acid transport system substrate-binding protein
LRHSFPLRATATAFVIAATPLAVVGQTAPNATVSGDTIVFGQYADQSGPNAPTGAARYGLDAYLQSVNAGGGVDGKKLRLISYDDGYKPSQTVALVKKLVFEDGAFAIVGGVGTPTTNAVAPTLEDLGVPLVAMSTGSPIFYDPVRPHVFPAWPLYTTDGKTMASFVKSHFKGKKAGVIYQDDAFGKPILAAVQATLGNDVETSAYTPGQLDFSDALLKFKSAGVDVIILATIAPPAAQILNALPKLDYHPERVLTSSACGYTGIFTTIDSLDGTYCAAFLPTPDASNPRWKRQRFTRPGAGSRARSPSKACVASMDPSHVTRMSRPSNRSATSTRSAVRSRTRTTATAVSVVNRSGKPKADAGSPSPGRR